MHHEPELRFADFYDVVLETSKLGGSLFPGAGGGLEPQHHPHRASRAAGHGRLHAGLHRQPVDFMLLVNVLLLIAVGCLMTTGEAILVPRRCPLPVAAAYGYDKVVFGLIMILQSRDRLPDPPVGLNLIVAMSAFATLRAALPGYRFPSSC